MNKIFDLFGNDERARLKALGATVNEGDVHVSGRTAYVDTGDDTRLSLEEVAGSWYISGGGSTDGFPDPFPSETVVDDVKLEETLKDNLEKSRGEKVKSVDCPSGVKVKAKTEFECTVTPQKGKVETAVLKIKNEDADIEVVEVRSGNVDLSLGG